MTNLKRNQRGMSLISVVFVGAVLVFGGVVAAQVFPTYIEYQNISKAVDKAKSGASVAEVRAAFDRASQIDDIKDRKSVV